MFDRYPYVLPLFFVWLPIWILVVLVFYTSFGQKNYRVLNRGFLMKFFSIVLLIIAIAIMTSGILRLAAINFQVLGRDSTFWHALLGYIFILAAANHITIHLKDIWRYLFKRPPKTSSKLNK